MKNIILTAVVAFILVSAQAQQRNTGNGARQQAAFEEKLLQISALADLDEKDRQFMDLYRKNPEGGYAFTAFGIAQEFAARGEESKMKFYADIYGKNVTDGKGNRIPMGQVYASVAGGMVASNPDAAAKYLKAGVDYAKASVDEMLSSAEAPNENLLLRAKNNYYAVLASYVRALSLGSNPESGYEFISKIYNDLQKQPDENARAYIESAYLQTLLNTDRYKEALPLLEKAIIAGGTPEQVSENLRKAYTAKHGSDANFDSYEKDLFEKQNNRLQQEIAQKSINELSHDFTLKDVDGNSVQLSDLKGKVVVLDFWATWCGPCKASFPAMQKAVDKYKDDPDVKFLFLHTWEKGSGDPVEGAKKYVVENNYTFHVLMDLRDPETKQSAVASAYKVNGIPTKIIIDPKGRIRFNTTGFSAQEDLAIKELSAMIEFAKKG